jgi:hypothetical protein
MNNKVFIQKNFFEKFTEKFLKEQWQKIIKPDKKMNGLCYIDGLVSTGNKFPYTILKINFAL